MATQEEMSSVKSKNRILVLAIFALLVMIAIGYFLLSFEKGSKAKQEQVMPKAEPEKKVQKADEKTAEKDEPESPALTELETEKIIGIHISGEEIIYLHETVARLEAELAACTGKEPKEEEVKKTTSSTAGRQSAVKKQTTVTPPKKEEKTVTTTTSPSSSQITDNQIAISQYAGEIVGDFGVTFDGESKLFFYVKESLLNSVDNRNTADSYLNGKTGAKGQIVGDYVLYKTNQTVLSNMLNNTWKYAIYVGDHTQYGYDMWLPHELVKLNSSLAENQNIEANSMGGYHFLSKINYKSK